MGDRRVVSRGVDLEQLRNDPLFSLGLLGSCATTPGSPQNEVGRGRTPIVREARIGTNFQERLDRG